MTSLTPPDTGHLQMWEVLRFSRERAGMAAEDLAALAGIDAAQVERWETDPGALTVERFLVLYRLTLPPKPPGWDAGHDYDAALRRSSRPEPPYDGVSPWKREYWETIDRWLAEVDRGGWFRRSGRVA